MPNTSQDMVKGIDISGLSSVSASEYMQLIDAGRTASDKGLNIVTTDLALNTPVVPNPNVVLEGVTPTWWIRYIWIRKPFDNTGQVILYGWNDSLASDPTYLQWQSTLTNVVDLTNQVNNIVNQVADLITQGNAQQASIDIINTNLAAQALNNTFYTSSITNIAALLNVLCPIGSLRMTSANEADSGTWMLADGRALDRVAYALLFTTISTIYGIGDGLTTFNLPDFRSRFPIGASKNGSVPAGLTQRVLGTSGGEENHLLTGQESGIAQHHHFLSLSGDAPTVTGNPTVSALPVSLSGYQTTDAVNTDAAQAHNNIGPFAPCFIMIRIA